MKTLAFVLTTIFVIAKIMGFIAWSWWLVFTPALACVGIELLIFIILMIIAGIAALFNKD